MMRWIAVLAVVFCGGCANSLIDQHAKMLDGVRAAAAQTAERLGQEGMGQVQAGGHVIDPGIVVEAAVVYRASARFAGVAGQLQASQQGKLDRDIDPVLRSKLFDIWNDTKNEFPDKMQASVQALVEYQNRRQASGAVK